MESENINCSVHNWLNIQVEFNKLKVHDCLEGLIGLIAVCVNEIKVVGVNDCSDVMLGLVDCY